jgi:thymidylate synthase
MVLGFPPDVAGFALLQMILAQRLGVRPGIYTHTISNAHIYDNHYDAAREMVVRQNTHKPIHIELPSNTFERAEKKEHVLVSEIVERFQQEYNPQEAIKNLKIAL